MSAAPPDTGSIALGTKPNRKVVGLFASPKRHRASGERSRHRVRRYAFNRGAAGVSWQGERAARWTAWRGPVVGGGGRGRLWGEHRPPPPTTGPRSEEHTSELQS